MKPQCHLFQLLPPSCAVSARAQTHLDPVITGVALHSGLVAPGNLFAALPGNKTDGRQYIAAAIAAGASAILAPLGTELTTNTDSAHVALVTDPDPRRRFAEICAKFYERQPRTIIAITGTNGKTSVAQFTRELWAMTVHKAASLGTLGLMAPNLTQTSMLTTPDTVSLHRDLAMLAENNVTHLALEASSHALDQFRLDGVKLQAAAFTNLTRDHLDYHPTADAYQAAKTRLFSELLPRGASAVLNADDPAYSALKAAAEAAGLHVVSYGENGETLHLVASEKLPDGQRLTVEADGASFDVSLPLIGTFQALNALCAAALVIATGGGTGHTLENLSRLSPVRGRLERIGSAASGAPVYIDYAHTPDGLETVLKALRPHTKGRLIVVFGCGGDRDPGKRPLMGEIASRLADRVIVTDDNPRTEVPIIIRSMIMAAAPGSIEIADRARAIQSAISELQTDDLLVIAGKGHEQGQIIGTETVPFDDADVARWCLETAA